MDDLDREIKLVQLQRERLALERELAQKDAGTAVKNFAHRLATDITSPFKALGRAFIRWRNGLMAVLGITVGIVASLYWLEQQEVAAQERWQKGMNVFTNEKCPACNREKNGTPFCWEQEVAEAICRSNAAENYRRQFPRP